MLAIAAAVPVEYQHEPHYSHDSPAEYEFSYSVNDPHTGDIKSQQESRKGDAVHGRYELIDSDGHKRIVEYTADEHSGFNAVVHREPTDIKVNVPVYVAKDAHYSHAPQHHYSHTPAVTHYVAPKVIAKVVAPVVHHHAPAPVAHYSHPAPVQHYSHAPSKVEYSHEPAHVTYNAPEYNYHY